MDKITTIICNYNHEKYLPDALESIANQTYRYMDVIIIDDCSDNDPIDIITKIDWRGLDVKYIRNKKNEGKWSCLNKVINSSNTKWYMIQDADDYAFPWKAEKQLQVLQQTKTLLNLAGYIPINVDDVHTVPNELAPSTSVSKQEIFELANLSANNRYIHHNYTGNYDLHNGATMFSRSFHQIGFRFQPPNMGLRIARSEDSDYNLRCTLQFNKTSWLVQPCYSYRLGSGHPQGSF